MEEIKVSEMLQADSIEKDNAIMIIQDGVNKKASGSIQTATGTSLSLTSVADTCKVKSNSKNMFDESIINNKWIGSAGDIVDQTGGSIQRYLCSEGDTFTLSATYDVSHVDNIIGIAFYNSNGTLLRRTANNTTLVITETAPANTAYMWAGHYYKIPKTMQLEQGSTATSYNPYNTEVKITDGTNTQSITLTPQEEEYAFTYDGTTTLTSNGSVTIEYNTQSRLLNNDDLQALDGHLVSINSGIGSRVNFTKNKNLLSADDLMYGVYKIGDGTYETTTTNYCTRNKIEIDNTKNYVLSATGTPGTQFMYIMFYDANGGYLGYVSNSFNGGYVVAGSFSNYSQAKYINLRFDTSSPSNVMLEEGSTKTTYEAYNRSINVDGKEIYNRTNIEQYSTIEARIGTWIDGKPIYRKVFTGNLANNDVLQTNVDTLVNAYGSGAVSNRYRMLGFFTYYNSQVYYFELNKNTANQITMGVFSAGASATATDCNVIIEYTKTTD